MPAAFTVSARAEPGFCRYCRAFVKSQSELEDDSGGEPQAVRIRKALRGILLPFVINLRDARCEVPRKIHVHFAADYEFRLGEIVFRLVTGTLRYRTEQPVRKGTDDRSVQRNGRAEQETVARI